MTSTAVQALQTQMFDSVPDALITEELLTEMDWFGPSDQTKLVGSAVGNSFGVTSADGNTFLGTITEIDDAWAVLMHVRYVGSFSTLELAGAALELAYFG